MTDFRKKSADFEPHYRYFNDLTFLYLHNDINDNRLPEIKVEEPGEKNLVF